MAELNLHLVCVASRVRDCAEALHSRLPPDQWQVLTQLAAELVAVQESRAQGLRVVVVPLSSEVAEMAAALHVAAKL